MGKNNVKRKVVPMDSVENAATSPLDEIVRRGAREMLQTALEAEVYAFIANYEDDRDEQGHRLVVRNGHLKYPNDLGQTAYIKYVGLENVGIGQVHQVPKSPRRDFLLPCGYSAVQCIYHLTQPSEVILRKWLFKVCYTQFFQSPPLLYRRRNRVSTVCVEA